MKEEYLHFIWRQKLLSKYQLFIQNKKSLTIIDPGQWNSNSGPDFLQAKIKIDETIWVGHVEIHINASDWFAHHHEDDPNYDTVILHVVLNPFYNIQFLTSGELISHSQQKVKKVIGDCQII